MQHQHHQDLDQRKAVGVAQPLRKRRRGQAQQQRQPRERDHPLDQADPPLTDTAHQHVAAFSSSHFVLQVFQPAGAAVVARTSTWLTVKPQPVTGPLPVANKV